MASTPAQNRAALCGDPEKFAKIAPVENGARGAEVWLVMDPNRSIKLRWLHGALHDVTSELARLQFSRFGSHTWQPAINAYRCDKCIRVCVDLAGVERSRIDLTVQPERLIIRGARDVPEPTHAEGRAVQLLAMEIDYGPFEREVHLPALVDIEKVHAEQRNGLLWISLPLKL